jgi:hypothetical protein
MGIKTILIFFAIVALGLFARAHRTKTITKSTIVDNALASDGRSGPDVENMP